MKGFGSIAAVVLAIQEEARGEVERIHAETAAAIARLAADDARAAVVAPDAEVRTADARRRARERLADEDWADRQAALEARERWMARVVTEGERRLSEARGTEPGVDLMRLALEAASRLGGDHVQILVAPSDAAITDAAWQAALAEACGKAVVVKSDPAVARGCIARSADGRTQYDNTYAARARRFETAWRRALGQAFDRACAAAGTDKTLAVR